MAVCYSFTVAIGNGYKDGERKWDFVHNFVIITLGADFFLLPFKLLLKQKTELRQLLCFLHLI